MASKAVSLAALVDDEPLEEARVPSFARTPSRAVKLEQVAANPLNTRDIDPGSENIASIAESMLAHGQLQPCAAVSRRAFLAIYPEHETAIGAATYVQVTGARRRVAAAKAGLATIDVIVRDNLAESRAEFLSATAAENIDREDYNPLEEARAVELIVTELGSRAAAGRQLNRSGMWVTQRLNLLELTGELQALLRSGEIPIREAREIAKLPADEQAPAWAARKAEREKTPQVVVPGDSPRDSPGDSSEGQTPGTTPAKPQRPAPNVAGLIRKLGGTPEQIAEALRSTLDPRAVRQLAALLAMPTE